MTTTDDSTAHLLKNLEPDDDEDDDENTQPNSPNPKQAATAFSRMRRDSMSFSDLYSDADDDNSDDNDVHYDDNNAGTSGISICESERYFEANNRALKVLVVLCRGILNGDGKKLIDINAKPWCQIKPEKQVKPTNSEYVAEIKRRWTDFAGKPTNFKAEPSPKKWKTNRLLDWLDTNPITDASDIKYLEATAKGYRKAAIEAARKRAELADNLDEGKNWNSIILLLRMLHAIIEGDSGPNSIKAKFLKRLDISNDRLDIDNRNSTDVSEPTVWDDIADKCNDPGFNTWLNIYDTLHKTFATPLDKPMLFWSKGSSMSYKMLSNTQLSFKFSNQCQIYVRGSRQIHSHFQWVDWHATISTSMDVLPNTPPSRA